MENLSLEIAGNTKVLTITSKGNSKSVLGDFVGKYSEVKQLGNGKVSRFNYELFKTVDNKDILVRKNVVLASRRIH